MQLPLRIMFHCITIVATCCEMGAYAFAAGPVTVEVDQTAEGYRLLRGGQPYYVQGAVYWTKPDNSAYPLSGVVSRGGNSIRIGGDHLDKLVEAANELGATVTIGLPLQSQRLGFDYDDEAAVLRQFEAMKAIVLRHKDNPATLIWGVGNELSHGNEVSQTYSNLRVWNAVNDIAKLIHEVDPHHPAMTVIGTASLKRGDLKDIIQRCPDIDIIGINAYKDIAQVPQWLRRDGWTGPWMITEWGHNGSWQVERTAWGASIEPTSSENAILFQQRHHDPILKQRDHCLGAYVFFWQQAPWITPTWYSLFLDSGDQVEAVDVLEHAWTGRPPENRTPRISPLLVNGKRAADNVYLQAGTVCTAEAQVTDPDGDALTFQWQILPDDKDAGNIYPNAKPIELREACSAKIEFTAPKSEGPYRLLVFVRDGQWHVATANVPFYVQGGQIARSPDPSGPTFADVPYGDHERQVLDFYQAESDAPTPVVFFIHGGGWGALDKANVAKMLDVPRLLSHGISVAATNYRYVHQAQAAGIKPPVKWPLEDAARALQFLRSKAAQWNIDKRRIGACGGSAGACSSLWLALHDDMAQPNSPDPVARESTRLWCAAVVGAQTCLDPKTMREWIPNVTYGGHAFGFREQYPKTDEDKTAEFQRFYQSRDEVLSWIKEYSPLDHASADDPPLWLSYSQDTPAVKGEPQEDPTHSAVFGLMLEERLKPLGVEIIVTYPAKPTGPYRTGTDYFADRLKAEEQQ